MTHPLKSSGSMSAEDRLIAYASMYATKSDELHEDDKEEATELAEAGAKMKAGQTGQSKTALARSAKYNDRKSTQTVVGSQNK